MWAWSLWVKQTLREFCVRFLLWCYVGNLIYISRFYADLCITSLSATLTSNHVLKVAPRAKILIGYWLCFSLELFGGVNKLNHFLVLLCGVGFILISGLAFLVLRVVEKYPLSNKTQRMLHLAVFIFLALLCILIFDWYSSEYIKSLSESWGLNKC